MALGAVGREGMAYTVSRRDKTCRTGRREWLRPHQPRPLPSYCLKFTFFATAAAPLGSRQMPTLFRAKKSHRTEQNEWYVVGTGTRGR